MAQIITPITVNADRKNLLEPIVAKQYDTDSRFLRVTINSQGEKMEISSGADTAINAQRADGMSGSFAGEVNEDGTVTVPLTDWMLDIDDTVVCSISVIDGDEKLTSSSFEIEVEAAEVSAEQTEQPVSLYIGTSHTELLILRDEGGARYDLQSGESLHLGVAAAVGGALVIEKAVTANDGTSGEYEFTFSPSDTSSLTAGVYVYSISLLSGSDNTYVVKPSPFNLIAGVT